MIYRMSDKRLSRLAMWRKGLTDVIEITIAEESGTASNHWPQSFPAAFLRLRDARPTTVVGSQAGRFNLLRHGAIG